MEAKDLFLTKHQMTNKCKIPCSACPLGRTNNGMDLNCEMLEYENLETFIEIIEKWRPPSFQWKHPFRNIGGNYVDML